MKPTGHVTCHLFFRDHILTPADIHHIVTGYKFLPDLNFVHCCFGRAALRQLTRQVHVFAQSEQTRLQSEVGHDPVS